MNSVAYPGRIAISTCHSPIAANGDTTIGSEAAAAPRSSRGTVTSPRRRASTAKAVRIATESPASGHASHMG
jgi:hypothetical protein